MDNIDNLELLKLNDILVFDNFLSASKCESILKEIAIDSLWQNSKVSTQNTKHQYYEYETELRTSKTLKDYSANNILRNQFNEIANLLQARLHIDLNKLEDWQVTKYEKGEHYDFHNDCGCWQKHQFGERQQTVLIYLTSPMEGGETFFRALNHYIRPIQGRLVIWNNLLPNGNCNYGKIHAGLPVEIGVKIILTTWIREKYVH